MVLLRSAAGLNFSYADTQSFTRRSPHASRAWASGCAQSTVVRSVEIRSSGSSSSQSASTTAYM